MTPEQLPQRIVETGNTVTRLIHRAMENPAASDRLPRFLQVLAGELWPGAVAAALRTPQDVDGRIYRIADESIASALRTGTRPEIVADLYNRLPRDTVALQETVLEVARQAVLVMEQRNRVDLYPAGYLELLNNYVGRLIQMGRVGEAETQALKAVAFANDAKYSALPDMSAARAAALENQAHVLRETQRPSEALAPLEQARTIYEGLSRNQPEFKRSLALCLNNHIAVLTALDDPRQAVALGRQAAALFRELVAGVPRKLAEFASGGLEVSVRNVWPNYAICLVALASPLNKTGQYEESLAATTEAVSILSQLAEESPEYSSLLAQAQTNHAMALTGVERFEEALGAMSEAVRNFRELERLRPGTFTFYVAHSLRWQSLILAQVGRLPEALDPVRESAALFQKLEDSRPGSVTAELRGTLQQLQAIVEALGVAGSDQPVTA